MLKLDISGVHIELDEKLNKYVQRKLGRLDRYLPKSSREAAHGRVILSEEKGKSRNRFTCEVVLDLPKTKLSAKEATINIYAAIDIVEAKLKAQLLKYKTKNDDRRHRRVARRLRRFGRP